MFGLFSKKSKVDIEKNDENKAAMRALFNDAITDGDSYKIA